MQRLTAGRYGAVIRALEGIRNRQALTVMLGGFLLVAIVAGLGSGLGAWAASPSLAVGLNLLALILAASVVNAAGLALMDAARGENERGFIQLLSGGAGCLVRFLAIIALALLSYAAFLLLAAALLWMCRIPILGPVLLTILVPALVLGAALLLLGLTVAVSMIAPALWSGRSIREAVRELVDIAGHRPLEVLVSLILLGVLLGLIGSVASLLVLAGSTSIGGLAAGILSEAPIVGLGASDLPVASPALAVAGSIGFLLVLALLFGMLGVIQMNGLCHIYLQASEGAEPDADDNGGEARPTVRRVRIVETAADPWEELPNTQQGPTPPGARGDTHATCPACEATVEEGDRFCGDCGCPLEPLAPPPKESP
ncbi:MAG: zinc ribbon domain-containing protein [Rhodocyclaceae bacterium]|nr:zinc ribbon domain-containing protein [Rhodocyclaceae bacterium]